MEGLPDDILRKISDGMTYKEAYRFNHVIHREVAEFHGDHRWMTTLYELEHYTRTNRVNDETYKASIEWCERYRNDTFRGDAKWTDEQVSIIGSEMDVTIVQAFAGTGKTTTLFEYIRRRPEKKILYLAFNKELEQSAKRRAKNDELTNVDIFTTHAFALEYLKKNKYITDEAAVGVMKVKDIVAMGYTRREAYDIAMTLRTFCASDSLDVQMTDSYLESYKKYVFDNMKKIWNAMIAGDLPLSHDVYLKYFQMKQPKMEYDVIMVDEVQDCTPCQMAIVSKQNCKKIYVGDIHQQIYKFRGVCDPFDTEDCLQLTRTFRFGFDLADVTNTFLSIYKNETKKMTTPKQCRTKLMTRSPISDKYTIICRTHAGIMQCAMTMRREFYLMGIKPISIEKEKNIVKDLMNIEEGNLEEVIHRKLIGLAGDEFLENIIQKYPDSQRWRMRVALYRKYAWNVLLEKYDEMQKYMVDEKEEADVIITNVHQSKGLEFDNVVLNDDFANVCSRELRHCTELNKEEYNLIYVAMTRAKLTLTLNKQMMLFLRTLERWGHEIIIGETTGMCVRCDTYGKCHEIIKSTDDMSYIGVDIPTYRINESVCITCFCAPK